MLRANSKIFAAYEDPDSFSAISRFDGLPAPRIPATEVMETVSFSGFWQEQSWGHAVTAATGADIIIVSLSGHADLPVPVRRWMESLPDYEQKNHTTLVVLFANEEEENTRQHVLISYFQQIATNHGLDFLCPCDVAENFQANPPVSEPTVRVELPRAERPQALNLLAVPLVS